MKRVMIEGFLERYNQMINTSGLKHRDIYTRAGIKKTSYYNYLNVDSVPDVGKVIKICALLHTSIDWLAFGKGEQKI